MSVLLFLIAFVIADDSWPGFLGAGASLPSNPGIPLRWSPDDQIAWTTSVSGHGQSSPVVWNGQVMVTTVEGPRKDNLHLEAIDLQSGRRNWQYTTSSTDPVENSLYVSRAAPTPVVDANGIYAFFESGDLVCVNHQGKEIWKRSISQDYGKFQNKFGLSGSPVQTEDRIIVLIDDEGPSYLLALDKKSGETIWKQDREPRASWSSPGLVRVGQQLQIVVSSAGSIDGYSPVDGKLLWSFSDIGGNTATTPIDLGEGKFFVAASGGRDGKNTEIAKKSNALMQIVTTSDGWEVKRLWLADGATPTWGSPIAHRGCAYWINTQGVIFCFDLETGKLHYKEGAKQSSWATPIGIGDHVYFFGKEGITTVIKAGPNFEVVSENELWKPEDFKPDEEAASREPTEERRRAAAMFSGPTLYGYAIAQQSILLRIGDRVYCVRDSK